MSISLIQAGLLLDLVAGWFLFSDQFGYGRLDRIDRQLEELAEEGTLPGLISREWMLDREHRGQTLARHALGLLILAFVATLFLPSSVVHTTASLGLLSFMSSIAGAWSSTSALVPPALFGVAFFALAAVLSVGMLDLRDVPRRVRTALWVTGILTAAPVLAVMWVVLIPLSLLYGLAVFFSPFVQALTLSPLRAGRWMKDHGGPDRLLPGAGVVLLSFGFLLQFAGTL